jgi:hypothetical protein
MKSIIIRDIEPLVADKLKKEAKLEGKSVNQFIKDMIKNQMGMGGKKKHSIRHHDLDHLFGQWDEIEFKQIQGKIDQERQIDEDLWK